MKTLKNILLLSLLIALFLPACKKYPDGPSISLRSRKGRLAGDWKLEKFLFNGTDMTSSAGDVKMTIEKDGKYKVTIGSFSDEGTWELGEDKDDAYFKSSQPNSSEEAYRILMLKNKELHWRQTQANGDVEEYHYVPQ